MFKNKKIVISMVLVFMLILPFTTFALKKDYKVFANQSSLPANKEFVIQFDQPLRESTVNKSNVYVENNRGLKVPTEPSLSSDGKSIIVKPLKPYINDNSYTLYIRRNIRYTSGKRLNNGIKLGFSIAPYKEGLPVVSSRQKLLKLLAEAQKQSDNIRGFNWFGMKLRDGAVGAKNEMSAAPKAGAIPGDYSTTNVQVQGVDEADIVKTDGEYIYQVSRDMVKITRAYPAEKLELIKTIHYHDKLQPMELYIDDKYMIVIGYFNMEAYKNKDDMFNFFDSVITMKIYDVSDKSKIEEVREIQLDGQYVSSRKVGSEFYLIANKYINYDLIRKNSKLSDTPQYRDSAQNKEFIKVDYDSVKYFPGTVDNNYLIVAGLSLDTPKEKLNVDTYLGAGEKIYCSEQNLYVAVSKYNKSNSSSDDPILYDSANVKKPNILPREDYSIDTLIYRFALNRGKLEYITNGTVPGTVLNQFSMDEYDNAFRIATTKGNTWRRGEDISKNNLYILDMDMKQVGKLEDIAPGEKIYSVRFMGERAYMVTFRTVDPLFVIDLKDKAKPEILGALKIPGYSDYLHPYDENHIIGFGKDTQESNGNAYYMGMKLAMFDITDVSKPKEMFVEKIGDRGTESPLLYDHKALLFSKEKNLMAFPVTLMEINDDKSQDCGDSPAYGSFTYQGAYVYNVDLEHGFRLKSRITHLKEEDLQKAGRYWYESDRNVQRIIYIGSNLYTISNDMIKVHDLSTFREIKSLELR